MIVVQRSPTSDQSSVLSVTDCISDVSKTGKLKNAIRATSGQQRESAKLKFFSARRSEAKMAEKSHA
jgi:hypothetical protein